MFKPAKSPKDSQMPPTPAYPVPQRSQLAMPVRLPLTLPGLPKGKK